MARTYAQAFINIAACSSTDGSGGCFKERASADEFVNLDYTGTGRGSIKVGRSLLGFGNAVARGPLLSRGWVVQERLLSRRKLYYADDQLYWHCSESYMSESGDHTTGKDFQLDVERNFKASARPKDQFQLWRNLLVDYTACQLTRDDDKLPTISGLAEKFAALLPFQYSR
jgi:hypothetical protein